MIIKYLKKHVLSIKREITKENKNGENGGKNEYLY